MPEQGPEKADFTVKLALLSGGFGVRDLQSFSMSHGADLSKKLLKQYSMVHIPPCRERARKNSTGRIMVACHTAKEGIDRVVQGRTYPKHSQQPNIPLPPALLQPPRLLLKCRPLSQKTTASQDILWPAVSLRT